VLYTEFAKSKGFENWLYLQAIKSDDGTLLFSSAVKVASFNNPPGTTHAIAGPNKNSDPSSIYVVYKVFDTKTVMQTTVTVSNGKVDEPTKLVADSGNLKFFPDGMISASNVFGVVLARQEKQNKKLLESFKVYYNGATSQPQVLDLTAPTDYQSPNILSFNYKDGFILLAQYLGKSNAAFVMKIFNADGTEQAAQKTIGYSNGNMMFFQDADGNLWLGYNDFDLSNGKISKSYLGKVLEA